MGWIWSIKVCIFGPQRLWCPSLWWLWQPGTCSWTSGRWRGWPFILLGNWSDAGAWGTNNWLSVCVIQMSNCLGPVTRVQTVLWLRTPVALLLELSDWTLLHSTGDYKVYRKFCSVGYEFREAEYRWILCKIHQMPVALRTDLKIPDFTRCIRIVPHISQVGNRF